MTTKTTKLPASYLQTRKRSKPQHVCGNSPFAGTTTAAAFLTFFAFTTGAGVFSSSDDEEEEEDELEEWTETVAVKLARKEGAISNRLRVRCGTRERTGCARGLGRLAVERKREESA